jgi:hypothetical protein
VALFGLTLFVDRSAALGFPDGAGRGATFFGVVRVFFSAAMLDPGSRTLAEACLRHKHPLDQRGTDPRPGWHQDARYEQRRMQTYARRTPTLSATVLSSAFVPSGPQSRTATRSAPDTRSTWSERNGQHRRSSMNQRLTSGRAAASNSSSQPSSSPRVARTCLRSASVSAMCALRSSGVKTPRSQATGRAARFVEHPQLGAPG